MGDDIRRGIWRVLWRIGCFCAFYGALLLLTVAAFAGIVYLTVLAVRSYPLGMPPLGAVAVYGVFAVLFAFAFSYIYLMAGYLLCPLTPMRQKARPDRMRIDDVTAPGLMALIREVAAQMHCPMPKNVLLSAETNASVTLKSNTWTVLFPERRTLNIGCGLLLALNRQELKGIIAHEFGHVAQGGAWISSLSSIVFDELSRFITPGKGDKAWEQKLLYHGLLALPALPAVLLDYYTTGLIAKVCVKFQASIGRQCMRLKRDMEYDADIRAAHVVGSEAFVSALCKVYTLGQYANFYDNLLISTIEDYHTISEYWEGYDIVKRYAGDHFGYIFTAADTLADVIYVPDAPVSRLIAENPTGHHPHQLNRIRAIKEAAIPAPAADRSPALRLVSPKLMEMAGRLRLRLLNEYSPYPPAQLPLDRFERNVVRKYCVASLPAYYEAFINREILLDNPDSIAPSKENPFVDDNKRLLFDYIAAQIDLQRMRVVKAESDVLGDIIYDGRIYPAADPPIQEVERRIAAMEPDIAGIDRAVCARLKHHCIAAGDDAPYRRYCKYLRIQALKRLLANAKRELIEIQSLGYTDEIRSRWRGRPHNLARRIYKLKLNVSASILPLLMPHEAEWMLDKASYDEFTIICRYFEQPLSALQPARDLKLCAHYIERYDAIASAILGIVNHQVLADISALYRSTRPDR